jgi:hypothetical protein
VGDRLVDRCGFVGGCRSVKGFVRKLRGRQFAGSLRRERDGDPRRDPSRLRHRAHVLRSAQGGKYRRTSLFVLTLTYSHKPVCLILFRSSSRTRAKLFLKLEKYILTNWPDHYTVRLGAFYRAKQASRIISGGPQ